MKKEILMLIIGILIGAIITTGVFLVLKGNDSQNRMNMGEPPTMDGNSINGGRGPSSITQENTEQNNSVSTNTTTNE